VSGSGDVVLITESRGGALLGVGVQVALWVNGASLRANTFVDLRFCKQFICVAARFRL